MLSVELILKGSQVRNAIHCVIISSTLVHMQEFCGLYEDCYIGSSSDLLDMLAMFYVLDKGFYDIHILHQFRSNVSL